jgi:transcription termination factor Rho
MSPRAKKTSADDRGSAEEVGLSGETGAAGASSGARADETGGGVTKPRRGRKSAAESESAPTSSTTKRRGRPPGSKNKPKSASDGAVAAAADAPPVTEAGSAEAGSAEAGSAESGWAEGAAAPDAMRADTEPRAAGQRRGRGARSPAGSAEAEEAAPGAEPEPPAEASDDGAVEEDTREDTREDGRGAGGRGQQRSRRSRGGQRKASLNFRDLQGKIVPELHLLAKEVGLEAYREMSQDELVIAVLERSTEAEGLRLVSGYLEISSDGYGFLQESLLKQTTRSVIVSAGLIKQFRLRTGDVIMGKARRPRDNERYGTLIRVEAVNGVDPFQAAKRPRFDDLVPTFPDRRIRLETAQNDLSARVIDLLAPIGRGQRGLIVAPPKAGKTTLLKAIAKSAVANEPDITVIVLLVDERPEEVTDFRESVQGVEVVASTFDEPPANHIRVAEFVHERSRRIVEDGGHVMILLDSITRLARANNLVTPATGRTLSGGLDSNALHWPKRFLGAARNIRGGGSLSILATALVETGSRMDDVIFEEFKGTGNMELHLSRRLEERRIFPAIDILKSGTRREDLLLSEDVLAKMWLLRKVISDMDAAEAMEMLLSRLNRTKNNAEFLSTLGQG